MRYYLLIASVLFIALSWVVNTAPYFPLDLSISRSIQAINFPGFAPAMTFLSDTGWGIQLYIFVGLAILLAYLLGKKLAALFIVLISIFDTGLFFGVANLVNRSRPSSDLVRVDFPINVGGYPSGHVLMYTLIVGFLLYLTSVHVKKKALKFFLEVIFISLITLMGIARIYSGQHWPSDILGGYLLGSIGLIIAIYFYRRLRDQAAPVSSK